MPWTWYTLSPCLMFIWLCTSKASCPSNCSCNLDEKGRKAVFCLQGGMIDSIPVNDMDPAIEVLDITSPQDNWNSLKIGPVFQPFKMLEEIRITRSQLTQIGMHTFWGVPTLKVLDLAFNNISTLYDHNFRGLLNLLQLHLDDNQIQKMPSGVFKHLTELRILTLERNRLKEIVPKQFLKLNKLEVIKLSGNHILELTPDIFKDIVELRTLHCRSCGIHRINTQIYYLLPYLTHLDLGNNRLQYILTDTFEDLKKIHSLKLDGNLLSVIVERTFVRQGDLETLCLARNQIVKLTNTAFLNLSKLYELDVSYNQLNNVETASFQPLSESLRKLSLSGNLLSTNIIRDVLQTTIKLRELNVADMRISEITPGLFPDHLKALNLSGNNLTQLGLKALPRQLVELDISRNKFRGLDERVVIRLEKIKHLELEDNPWSCDLCHMKAMFLRINKSIAFQKTTCASPLRLKGLPLNSLSIEDLVDCALENDYERDRFLTFVYKNLGLLIGGIGIFLFLVGCVVFVVVSCLQRRANIVLEEQKRNAETDIFQNPTAIFSSKGEVSFKFTLDLTERRVSVSTIDEIKRDTIPNGIGAGIRI